MQNLIALKKLVISNRGKNDQMELMYESIFMPPGHLLKNYVTSTLPK